MHSNDCVHQDVKLEHVLLDSEGNVKLLDFGMSIIVDEETEYTEVCGTVHYVCNMYTTLRELPRKWLFCALDNLILVDTIVLQRAPFR